MEQTDMRTSTHGSPSAGKYLIVGHAAAVEILFKLLEMVAKPDLQWQKPTQQICSKQMQLNAAPQNII